MKTRFDWDTFFEAEPPACFRRMFRLSKHSFTKALGYIEHLLEPKEQDKAKGNSGCIVPTVRFAVALRYLAGGSSWDIKLAFRLHSLSEFYKSVWMVVDAINSVPEFEIPDFPFDDPGLLVKLEEGFAAKSRSRAVRGCVGALYGCVFHQKNSGVAVPNPKRYFCARKDKFGVLLTATCNADRQFT